MKIHQFMLLILLLILIRLNLNAADPRGETIFYQNINNSLIKDGKLSIADNQIITDDKFWKISYISGDFLVNDNVWRYERCAPVIAIDKEGNFVIVWDELRDDDVDIYMQRFSGYGIKIGENVRINDENIKGWQRYPAIAMDDNGNFIVTWMDSRDQNCGWDIYAQRYGNDGMKQGENFLVNDDSSAQYQNFPDIAVNSEGNFVIVWEDNRQGKPQIFVQMYQHNGMKKGINFQVIDEQCNKYSYFVAPAIAMNDEGGFVVVWQDTRNEDDDIYGQQFNADGTKLGVNFQVNDGNSFQGCPDIGMDDYGNFVVVWQDLRNGQRDIYQQSYTRICTKLGVNQRVNDNLNRANIGHPIIGMDHNGHYVVVWWDFRNNQNDNPNLFRQLYDGEGIKIGSNCPVFSNSNNKDEGTPDVKLAYGTIYYTWEVSRKDKQGNDILARIDIFSATSLDNSLTNKDFPENFQLFQNFPNPFNPCTSIQYSLPKANQVSLKIYNISGQEVKTLVENQQEAGEHFVEWDGILSSGEKASSGMYYCQLKVGNEVQVRKMVLAK